MNSVQLYGSLAQNFGSDVFRMDVRDPMEAYRALACQIGGFREAFRQGEYYLVRELPNGQLALTEDMLFIGMSNCKLHIMPAIEGAAGTKGKSTAKIVLGTALFVGSLFIPGSTAFLGMAVKSSVMLTGAALALGGAALLIAPQPKSSTAGQDDSSKLINGDFNPSGQNFAVPIVCGKFRVKDMPVATEVVTNEYSVPSNLPYNNPYQGYGYDENGNPGYEQQRYV